MITWQNGTEGSQEIETGEYVTINGVDYPVKTKIQSPTPLSAENLNENQQNLIDFLQLESGNYVGSGKLLDIKAVANLEDNLKKLALNNHEVVTNIMRSNVGTVTGTIYIDYNDDGTAFKIYGAFTNTMKNVGSGSNVYSFQTPLRPAEPIMVTCIGIAWGYNTAFTNYLRPVTLTIGVDGIARTNALQYWNDWTYQVLELFPVLYFGG